jgi:hypothetical protein
MTKKIAYFVSSHGFGHAARASAVMAAIGQRYPDVTFNIYTQAPAWFFHSSLTQPFTHNLCFTDVGLVQENSLHENEDATLTELSRFLPFSKDKTNNLVEQLNSGNSPVQLVLCDISPLGIAVARAAEVPSVLIENFTWDWIYEGYRDQTPGFEPYIEQLADIFGKADYHVQTEPICRSSPTASLTAPPVCRVPRQTVAEVRRRLGVSEDAPVVVLTMGGAKWDYTFFESIRRYPGVSFVVAGSTLPSRENLITLPGHTDIYHPDLINAASVVIGKVGYSTLAEVYQSGVPFGYITRNRFRESPVLVQYIDRNMAGQHISEEEFISGKWLEKLPALLTMPRQLPLQANGAGVIADFVLNKLQA